MPDTPSITKASAKLNILNAAAAVVKMLVRRSGRWLVIAWLPWLLGTVAIVVAREFCVTYFQIGWPPGWVQVLILAPFSAMIFVRILKNLILDVPVELKGFDISSSVWIVAASIALLGLVSLGIEALRFWHMEQTTLLDYTVAHNWAIAALVASWLAEAAIVTVCYPAFAVIVDHGRFDLSATLSIARNHFLRLFGLALLLGGAFKGFEGLYAKLLVHLDLVPDLFDSLLSTREATIATFLKQLAYLPLDIIADVLPAVTIGTVYASFRNRRAPAGDANRTSNGGMA